MWRPFGYIGAYFDRQANIKRVEAASRRMANERVVRELYGPRPCQCTRQSGTSECPVHRSGE